MTVEVNQKVIEQKWIPTNIEVRVMYSQANARDRGLLLVLYQSGFSEIDAASLNIEDLNDIYCHEGHLFIQKRREKTNIIQATCISTEAIHDIRAMLRERDNPEKGALFVSQKGQRLSVRFINGAMKRLAKTAYPDKKFKTKSLRSAYNSALLRANIQPQELKDLLMGHKRAGARSHYAYDKITILEAYEKAFQYLSINSGTQARKDIERIENSLITLTQTIAKQQTRINELQTKLESLFNALREGPFLLMKTETPDGKETYTLVKSEKLHRKPENIP
ncbi:MAG: site-specific integrase [Candidatus Bathyarchaeota archaeon]|nr:site-specific integrase [Candidatus Bathyarchaeota archaeon]